MVHGTAHIPLVPDHSLPQHHLEDGLLCGAGHITRNNTAIMMKYSDNQPQQRALPVVAWRSAAAGCCCHNNNTPVVADGDVHQIKLPPTDSCRGVWHRVMTRQKRCSTLPQCRACCGMWQHCVIIASISCEQRDSAHIQNTTSTEMAAEALLTNCLRGCNTRNASGLHTTPLAET